MLGFPVKDVKRGEMVLYEMKKMSQWDELQN